jgi:hypothetical protein
VKIDRRLRGAYCLYNLPDDEGIVSDTFVSFSCTTRLNNPGDDHFAQAYQTDLIHHLLLAQICTDTDFPSQMAFFPVLFLSCNLT